MRTVGDLSSVLLGFLSTRDLGDSVLKTYGACYFPAFLPASLPSLLGPQPVCAGLRYSCKLLAPVSFSESNGHGSLDRQRQEEGLQLCWLTLNVDTGFIPILSYRNAARASKEICKCPSGNIQKS